MRIRHHVIGLGLLAVVGAAVPAFAQEGDLAKKFPACTKPPTDAQSDDAHNKYIAGKREYDQSNWDSAITYFTEAYKLDCTKHELLVIISRAYESKHDFPNAIDALTLYLSRAGNAVSATDRDTYEKRIKRLRDEQQKAQPTPTAPPTTTTAPPPTSTATTAPTHTNTSPPPPPESHHSPWPFVLGGVGAAAVIVGVVVIATTPALPGNCNADTEKCAVPDNIKTDPNLSKTYTQNQLPEDQDKAGKHKSQPVIGGAIVAAGGLMVVGGVIWFFVEPTGPERTGKLKFTPQLAPGYGGFSLTKSF